ncbi:hypothetical protein Tco_1270495 [Tanacetum coccineum]
MNDSISPSLGDAIEDLLETRTAIRLEISEGNIRDIKRGKNHRPRKIPPTPYFLPNRHHIRTGDQAMQGALIIVVTAREGQG